MSSPVPINYRRRYIDVCEKLLRQRKYQEGVARRLRSKVADCEAADDEDGALENTIDAENNERFSNTLRFIFTAATNGLPQVDIDEIVHLCDERIRSKSEERRIDICQTSRT